MVLKEIKERERERETELAERFNADKRDILAFSIAAWQLFIPVIIALLVVGFLMIFLLDLI
jgi:CHASE3 domain sensor protein